MTHLLRSSSFPHCSDSPNWPRGKAGPVYNRPVCWRTKAMLRQLDHRAGHYLLLLVVAAATCLPHLGTPSLWDIDEGHNAEAAREMLASGNWIVPTFNFELRVDKP